MAHTDIFSMLEALRAQGRPFCLATVVRTADVTSAKAGAKAAITEDGAIHGHLGGACVQRAVVAVAGEVLAAGTPRLIRVKPSEKVVSLADPDGVELFKSGCPSGGTVELLIEAFVPAPTLLVIGDSPIADALADHAGLMDFRVDRLPEGNKPLPTLRDADFVVLATQGRHDSIALKAALASPARFISMIASRRKAETLCTRLREQGVAEADLSRLKAPAGLHIGGVDPSEIAISILAEIIQHRRRDAALDTHLEEVGSG